MLKTAIGNLSNGTKRGEAKQEMVNPVVHTSAALTQRYLLLEDHDIQSRYLKSLFHIAQNKVKQKTHFFPNGHFNKTRLK